MLKLSLLACAALASGSLAMGCAADEISSPGIAQDELDPTADVVSVDETASWSPRADTRLASPIQQGRNGQRHEPVAVRYAVDPSGSGRSVERAGSQPAAREPISTAQESGAVRRER